jgi:hypothetical protein
MKRSLLFAAALAATLAAAAQSRADSISTAFWYNWTRNPISIGTVQQSNPGQAGTGGINLLDLNSNAIQAQGETGTPAADVQVISSATSSNKDVIPVGGGKYTLTLTLSDQNPASNTPGTHIGTVSFTGQLQGNVTADSSNLTNSILSSTDATGTHTGQNWAQIQIGNTLFTVTYSGFAEPGPSNEHTFGAISFHITQQPAVTGKSPEPSSVVLGCLGLTCLGGVVWRARRRKAAALKAVA